MRVWKRGYWRVTPSQMLHPHEDGWSMVWKLGLAKHHCIPRRSSSLPDLLFEKKMKYRISAWEIRPPLYRVEMLSKEDAPSDTATTDWNLEKIIVKAYHKQDFSAWQQQGPLLPFSSPLRRGGRCCIFDNARLILLVVVCASVSFSMRQAPAAAFSLYFSVGLSHYRSDNEKNIHA